jgi:hypothetical protein
MYIQDEKNIPNNLYIHVICIKFGIGNIILTNYYHVLIVG